MAIIRATTIAVTVAIDMAATAIVKEDNMNLTLELPSPYLLGSPNQKPTGIKKRQSFLRILPVFRV
ncbi:MAG: hypothetical protein PHY16_11420 [Methylobacter sp.]|nr:hypothetical protein [Methylobacter sp.]